MRLFLRGTCVVLCLFCLAGCAALKGDRDAEPGAADAEVASIVREGNTTRYTSESVMIEASYLPPLSRGVYFSIFKGGAHADPFPGETYLVFSLTLENRGSRRMSFNPGMTFLVSPKGEPSPAVGFTSFYTVMSVTKTEDIDARMEAFKAACFDTALSIGPGERVQKLIVFIRHDSVKDSAGLLVGHLYIGQEARSALLDFSGALAAE